MFLKVSDLSHMLTFIHIITVSIYIKLYKAFYSAVGKLHLLCSKFSDQYSVLFFARMPLLEKHFGTLFQVSYRPDTLGSLANDLGPQSKILSGTWGPGEDIPHAVLMLSVYFLLDLAQGKFFKALKNSKMLHSRRVVS